MTLASFTIPYKIQQLQQQQLLRHTKAITSGVTPYIHYQGKRYINFSSNDYLGMAEHPEVASSMQAHISQYGVGSGASHLVSGHFDVHEQLEHKLAELTGCDAAMLFSSGFMANVGVIAALIGKEDTVLQDRLNHASLIDGARLSKAQRTIYEHLDYRQLAEQLQGLQENTANKLIITDNVFSMDGTLADLTELSKIANTYDAGLLIDDAHGFGLYYGYNQKQHNRHNIDVYMGTFGKSLGTYGAFVAGSTELITYLKTKARSYVFTTALPTSLAQATLTALAVVSDEQHRQAQLKKNISQLRQGLQTQGWQLLASDTAIQPVIIGSEEDTLKLAQQLQEAGFWVIAIRPPTVPKGSSRLRITLSANHTENHIAQLLSFMKKLSV